ncbi:MAG: S-methyl-5-thioribose-1-phosphate isomerase, partial [Bacteroidetes bacterium]|nr:S-methyl-5-thioribose-1-phosphate isomerase [Bacteroidota bacterium]
SIGAFGCQLIERISAKKNRKPVNILTHCNAGWLACIDYGTATAPIYAAHEKGIPVHVWVDETRPRNQGARITAFELLQQGVPHTVIPDNTGGHLMQHNKVDMVIVGSDRTTRTGDVANKIGTYLKALAAHDNDIPFYVALPSSSFDLNLKDGFEIPIEQRNEDEVKYIQGLNKGEIKKVLLTPFDSRAANYAFDVTPARLVTGLITEHGLCEANEKSIIRTIGK